MRSDARELILVRHGETEWNAAEIFRGRADIPLNERGLEQARRLGEYLGGEKIDAIFTSPLQRAVATAQAIAKHQALEVQISPLLIDIDCGHWQGLTVAEVKEKYPWVYQDWLNTPEKVKIPGGESLDEVRERATLFFQGVVAGDCGQRLVLVSHRVVTKVLICALLGIDNSFFWKIRLDTGGITRFEIDGKRAVLTAHNDVSYMRNLPGRPQADF